MDIFLNAFVFRLMSVCCWSRRCTVAKRLNGSRGRTFAEAMGMPVWAMGTGKSIFSSKRAATGTLHLTAGARAAETGT